MTARYAKQPFILWVFIAGWLFSAQGVGGAPVGPDLHPRLIAEETSAQAGRQTWIGVAFTIPKDWHLYWKNPGDTGRPPRVEWEIPPPLTIGELQWPRPERLSSGPLVSFGYSGPLLLMAPLSVPRNLSASPIPLAAKVSWLVCRDICIPGQTHLTLSLPVARIAAPPSQQSALFETTRQQLARPAGEKWTLSAVADGDRFSLRLGNLGAAAGTKIAFFPFEKHQFDNASARGFPDAQGIRLELRKSELAEETPKSIDGLIVVGEGPGQTAYAIRAPVGEARSSFAAVLRALLLAFLGGLILNLMPCVFPVLSIKAFSLLEQAHQERRAARLHGALYSLGVLVSFWALAGLLIGLRAGGERLGWGFQLQSSTFDAALISLLFLLSMNLLGVFELGGSLSGVGSAAASGQGAVGAFFTGVLATVVATPCTAPFMGTALGFASSQPAPVALMVFTALAIGLFLPYLLLSLLPGLGRVLPRPGRWMESLKQAMAFPLFATILWLLQVVGLQSGLVAVTKILSGLLLLAAAAWAYGRWRNRLSHAAVAALCAGAVWVGIPGARGTSASTSEEIRWEPYSKARVEQLRAKGKPVFVDFTAAWCVTCKVNETLALSSSRVVAKMRELGVVPLKGDWTNSDAEITQALAELGRNGVPLYVLYPHKKDEAPRILPQILTAQLVVDALDKVDKVD